MGNGRDRGQPGAAADLDEGGILVASASCADVHYLAARGKSEVAGSSSGAPFGDVAASRIWTTRPPQSPGAARVAGPVAVEPPEGLEQRVGLLGRDGRPGVAYLEFDHAALGDRPGGHCDPASGVVVLDAVADKVEREAFQEDGVAGGGCRIGC